jgi:HEAT repeat protein
LLRAGYGLVDDADELLAAHLDAPDRRQRVLALRGLVRRDAMDARRWRHVIDDEDVEIRRESLELLAHAPALDQDVADAAIERLHDEDALVVDAAAFALGEHLVEGAVAELCRVARDHEDARCRESAIGALGAIGDDRARATVIAALQDKPPVRRRAVVALANFEGPDVDAALAAAGEDRDWQVRAAVEQLRREDEP